MSNNTKDSSADELFDLKTAFYLGNFQQAINEAQKLKVNNPKSQTEKDVYMYRAFIAQKKYGVVFDEIKPSTTSDELKYVRILAEFLSNESKREAIVSDLDSKLGSMNISNPLVLLIIANIYYAAEVSARTYSFILLFVYLFSIIYLRTMRLH